MEAPKATTQKGSFPPAKSKEVSSVASFTSIVRTESMSFHFESPYVTDLLTLPSAGLSST
jgi:hypothetical protein